jgi:hypothetical protein
MKPTDNFSQFPENGMSTPEIGALGREVLRITSDGRIIKGEGLSTEEATQEAAKLLIQAFEQEIKKMVDNRLAADTARLDWLEANPEAIRAYSIHKSTFGRKVWWETGFGNYHTAREAIDAGMKETSK